MMPNSKLIPRFNIDYSSADFISAITHLKSNPETSSITSIFNDAHVNFTNSGRTSLYIILKALKLPDKSKIHVVFKSKITFWHYKIF